MSLKMLCNCIVILLQCFVKLLLLVKATWLGIVFPVLGFGIEDFVISGSLWDCEISVRIWDLSL